MLHTRICDLLGIEHPIVLGGMGGGHTAAPLLCELETRLRRFIELSGPVA